MSVFSELLRLWPQFQAFRSGVEEEEEVLPLLEKKRRKQRESLLRQRRREEEEEKKKKKKEVGTWRPQSPPAHGEKTRSELTFLCYSF